MNKDELKRLVCEYLDSHSDELIRRDADNKQTDRSIFNE